MALTPLLVHFADRLLAREKAGEPVGTPSPSGSDDNEEPNPVLIAGFGRVGRRIAELLQKADVPYLGIDQDAGNVARARERGFSVFFGNVTRPEVLQAAGIGKARLAIIAVDRGQQSLQAVRAIHNAAPDLPIMVRAVDREHCREMLAAGATRTYSENLETSLQIAAAAMYEVGTEQEAIQRLLDDFRQGYLDDMKGKEPG
jgi:voltage-gated potassium channel Kch